MYHKVHSYNPDTQCITSHSVPMYLIMTKNVMRHFTLYPAWCAEGSAPPRQKRPCFATKVMQNHFLNFTTKLNKY